MDFEAELRREMLSLLPTSGEWAGQDRTALEASAPSRLLIYFLNWRDRFIHPHPRRVERAAELIADLEYRANKPHVDRVFAETAIGQELWPRLSKDLRFGFQDHTRGGRRRDLDGLLSHWGIHHLHISDERLNDGHVKRDGPLLCAIFREEVAFFLGLIRHGEWTEERLVEAAVRNWPRERLFVELNVAAAETTLTPEQHSALRRKNVTSPISVDGHTFISSTFGVTGAGTSTRASVTAMHILRTLAHFQANPLELNREMRAVRSDRDARFPARPVYRIVALQTPTKYGLAIQELKTSRTLLLE